MVLMSSFFVACFKPLPLYKPPAKGVYHEVKKNETPEMIARAYNISIPDLIRANKIKDVRSIREGSIVFVPSATKVIDITKDTKPKDTGVAVSKPQIIVAEPPKSVAQPPKTAVDPQMTIAEPPKSVAEPKKPIPKKPAPAQKKQAGQNSFIWPVQGTVKSQFGMQPNKTFHNWIKISSVDDAKVKAAESGVVIFSSSLKNYGETIIIRHQDSYATVYTHLNKRYVGIDRTVNKGEIIASLGEKDEAGDVYFNFEIRFQGQAQNPLEILP
jgi:lipoprotein NlpD